MIHAHDRRQCPPIRGALSAAQNKIAILGRNVNRRLDFLVPAATSSNGSVGVASATFITSIGIEFECERSRLSGRGNLLLSRG